MLGIGAALLAAMTWGLSYAVSARLLHTYPPIFLMVMHALTSLPLLGIVICTSDGRKAVESLISGEKAGLLAADIALTFLAGFLILFAMTKTNPVNAAVIETSYPLFIALASFILFGSTFLNFGNLVGGLIIVIGIVIVMKWG